MTIWLAFVALILACMAFGYLVRMLQERSKRERREYADEIQHYQERGRHAASKPRQRPNTALVKPKAPKPVLPWYRDETAGEPRPGDPLQIPGKRYANWMRGAVDVILPEPDTYKPQPMRDSGAGTETFARLDLPATTGELAAVTDQYLADMAVKEEQFRLGLAT